MTLCSAKTKDGRPCKQPPMRGMTVCYHHGGATPQAKRKALERITEADARKALQKLGRPEPVTDPIAELQRVAGEATTWSQFLRSKVAELEGDLRYEHPKAGEQLRAEAAIYTTALRQTADVLGRIIALDLEARRVAINEAEAAIIIGALAKALGHRDLNLTSAQQRLARTIVVKELKVADVVEGTARELP